MHIYTPLSHYFPLIYIGLLCNRHLCVMGESANKHCQGETHKQPWRERERGETKRGGELVYHYFPSF